MSLTKIPFEILKGKICKIENMDVGSEYIRFFCNNGKLYEMRHLQSCCEDVNIEDICGDVSDIDGQLILLAEEECSDTGPNGLTKVDNYGSETWTFFKLSTIKGSVTIRWYGTSNGYYSETADLYEVTGEDGIENW